MKRESGIDRFVDSCRAPRYWENRCGVEGLNPSLGDFLSSTAAHDLADPDRSALA